MTAINVGDAVQLVIVGNPTRPAIVTRVLDAGGVAAQYLDLIALLDAPGRETREIRLVRVPPLAGLTHPFVGWIPPADPSPPMPGPPETY